MRVRVAAIAAALPALLTVTGLALATANPQDSASIRRIAWDDVAPLSARLASLGLTAETFPKYLRDVRRRHAQRVHEGDLDHLIFYVLQSTRFTARPAIEPALSAKALVEGLDPGARQAFLDGAPTVTPAVPSAVPSAVRARVSAFLRAREPAGGDRRLAYFRELAGTGAADARDREASLLREYLRVMRFVYEKEFVAQRAPDAPAAVAELYRTRGLNTDTAVEAGFLVHLGLGVLGGLEPSRRIRRVLIVGPGLDLAPRTAFADERPPESYQPWAVIDALLATGLSRIGELDVVAADINPRVVAHLRGTRRAPPRLTLVSEIRETAQLSLTREYRDYFMALGRAVGSEDATRPADADGRLRKTVQVGAEAALALTAEPLDIVTERIDGRPFDLVIATNILPYLDDTALMLAMANVAHMLAPDGIFLHNESRPILRGVTSALGLPFEQSRHAIIATVNRAPAPLFDSVFLHRRRR